MFSFSHLLAIAFYVAAVAAHAGSYQPDQGKHHPKPVKHHNEHTLVIATREISPDGFRRTAALANGQFPGPVLTAKKGESFSVNVINHLSDPSMRQSTSIHWHGIFQPHNSHNDGPSFVTQCPIAPGHSYKYKVETGDQAGTFWYHSHLATQYVDGIRGALVIYDPEDPFRHMYDIDDLSTIISLADWYHDKAEALEASFNNNGTEPVPDSGLINAIGRFEGGPQVKLARINVVHGKRYRFRVISMSADGFFDFAISNHSMVVIEADGISHKPLTVDSMNLGPGQRYSVVVTANQKVGNYWIRATQTVIGGLTSVPFAPKFNGNDTYAVFHYFGAPDAEPTDEKPTTLPPNGVPLEEFKLAPIKNPGLPGGENPPDLEVFNFNFTIGAPNGDVWTVNGIPYKPVAVPTLLEVLANGFTNTTQFPSGENVLVLPRNATIEVVFSAPVPFSAGHAFHLHGHAFDVVQSVAGPPNFINPPRRDVVQSGPNPTRIRFRTDNPGPWILHCHIDWHLAAGLAVVFVEDPKGIKKNTHPDPAWKQLCSIYDKLDPSQQ